MPFEKSVTDPSGVVSTYWVITTAHADFGSRTVMVSLSGWLDAASFEASLKPSTRRPQYFQVPFAAIPSVDSNATVSMAELYAAVTAMLADPTKPTTLSGATFLA
jgi:hypothetical protein